MRVGDVSSGQLGPLTFPLPVKSVPTFSYKRTGVVYALQFVLYPKSKPQYAHYGMLQREASAAELMDMQDHLRMVAGGLERQLTCGSIL
ncbi:MAG: hypothetical protein U1F30_11055 [Steroidobacteraceae bacterium]